MTQVFATVPAVYVTRGSLIESLHHAAVAVVRSDGKLLYSLGDPATVTFLRSSAKPFQAIPVVESGAFDHFGFGTRELALMCASHNGQPYHTEVAAGMLDRIGMTVNDLRCGIHAPSYAPSARALREAGLAPTPLHNNCSGKHAGMLALSKYLGVADRDYRALDHPVQQRNLAALADLADVSPDSIPTAIDGCSVPTFALPLHAAALAFARLMDPRGLAPQRAQVVGRITAAMRAHPELVGGDERFDTWLMATAPEVVTKGGAEGYQGIAVQTRGETWGIVARIADGDVTNRSKGPLVMEVLAQLGALPEAVLAAGKRWRYGIVTNRHGDPVGEIRAEFRLAGR